MIVTRDKHVILTQGQSTLRIFTIAFLQATSSILSFCYHVRAGLSNAPRSLTQITEEIRGIRNIVEAVQSSIDNCDKDTIRGIQTTKAICSSIQAPLTLCLSELTRIEGKIKASTLAVVEGSKCEAVLQAVGWRLKEQEVRDSLERLGRCKSALNLAINSQNM